MLKAGLPPSAALAWDPPSWLGALPGARGPGPLLRLWDTADTFPLQVQPATKLSTHPRAIDTCTHTQRTPTGPVTYSATDKVLPSKHSPHVQA